MEFEVQDAEEEAQFDVHDEVFTGDPIPAARTQLHGELQEPEEIRPPHDAFEERILREYKTRLFHREIPNYPNMSTTLHPIIELMSEHAQDTPCKQPHRLSAQHQNELHEQLKFYLNKGWIRPSDSPFGALILFVPKKNGHLRMCIDYRAINKITKKDKYNMPDAESIIEQVQGAKYLSNIDLAHGYHQCMLDPSDIPKTAFRTPFGSYEWTVMTFGLTNAVPAFIRHITNALQKHLGICCMAFIDDIIIYSKDLQSHERDVRLVLDALHAAKLCVNWVKSKFNTNSVEYLGLRISTNGISPLQNKVQAIQSWEPPTTTYHLRSFLGAVGFYRKFIHGFSRIAHPLTELTKDNPTRVAEVASNVTNAKFGRRVKTQSFNSNEWTAECQTAFETLKTALLTAPVLRLPDNTRRFEIMTDASKYACGAVLMQRDDNNQLHPVAYYSQKLSTAEAGYPVHEFELLAIFKALKHWRHLLVGNHATVYTDHRPLTHLKSQPQLSARQQRWITYLADYDVDIIAVEGSKNQVADALSRYPYDTNSITDKVEELRVRFMEHINHHTPTVSMIYDLMGFSNVSSMTPLACLAANLTGFPLEDTPQFFGGVCAGCDEDLTSFAMLYSEDALQTPELNKLVDIRQSLIDSYSQDKLAKGMLTGTFSPLNMSIENGIIRYHDRTGGILVYVPKNAKTTPRHQITEHPVTGDEIRKTCTLREEIIREAHETYGHIGVGKLIRLIRVSYYWINMGRHIADYVRGCKTCQRNKAKRHKPYGTLRSLEIPTRRWAFVSIDWITDLPETTLKHNAILVAVDSLSKRAHFIATTTKASASEAANLYFDHIFKHHGMPLKIISDRDSKVTSEFWQTLWRKFGTKLALSTPHHPNTDGQTERLNATLEEMLRAFTDNARYDWDLYLTAAEFAYNNTVHTATKETPFMLDTGQAPLDPLTIAMAQLHEAEERPTAVVKDSAEVVDYLQQWQDKLEITRTLLEDAQNRSALYYDARRLVRKFEVNDQVYLDTRHLTTPDKQGKRTKRKTFDERRTGPFRILQVIGHGTAYRLKLQKQHKFHDVQPISRLEPLTYSTVFPQAHPEKPPQPVVYDERDEADSEEFEIEDILAHRMWGKVMKFWVRFKGYSNSANEWLTRTDLKHSSETLHDYELKHGLARKTRTRKT